MTTEDRPSAWVRFWHRPVRGELLGFTRILFAAALLTEQLTQFLPHLDWLFGPDGFAPEEFGDDVLLPRWRWSVVFFRTDNMAVIVPAFCAWVAVTAALLVGWRSRAAAILTWFATYCFQNRSFLTLNGGDDVLMIGLFLLMITPCGCALSLDRRRLVRKAAAEGREPPPAFIPPWPVRLFQIQLCVLYLATGIAKIPGDTWWDGTSVHYVLLDPIMTRWPATHFHLPLWITAPLTWSTIAFEVLFPLLVFWRRTRYWTLLFGVAFHLGIYLTVEVGWFSFYTLCMYGVWVPQHWWERRSAIEQSSSRR